jgi:MFS family permease
MSDQLRLYCAASLRAVATGMIPILVAAYLKELHYSPGQIGSIISAGLAGIACATLAATLFGDRLGRRRFLIGVSCLAFLGTALFVLSAAPIAIVAAAFVGMMNGMGRDRGGAAVVEEALLPATTADADRTRAFAWYNVLLSTGNALGAALAGLPFLIRSAIATSEAASIRLSLMVYGVLVFLPALFYAGLSVPESDERRTVRKPTTPETRRILTRISLLFLLDSLGGGFLAGAILAFFFFERFNAGPEVVGLLFFVARIANALSNFGAAWLAKRFGLVNTMVFTHIPASLFLLAVPFAPTFTVAAVFFLLRELLVEMDVPTRSSYVMAVVRPDERTLASGVTQLVRMCGWAMGPIAAGMLMQAGSLAAPLFVGAAIKIVYDLLLYGAFRHILPPEERG